MAEIYRRDEKKKPLKESETKIYNKKVKSATVRSEKKKFNYIPLKKVKSKK